MKEKVTRRKSLGMIILGLVLTPLVFLLSLIQGKTNILRQSEKPLVIKLPLEAGLSFHESVWVDSRAGNYRVIAAKCPHLGCTINQHRDDVLICPCHGSQFDLTGRIISGPANRDLTILPYRLIAETQTLVIDTHAK